MLQVQVFLFDKRIGSNQVILLFHFQIALTQTIITNSRFDYILLNHVKASVYFAECGFAKSTQ